MATQTVTAEPCYNCGTMPVTEPVHDMYRSGYRTACKCKQCAIHGSTYIDSIEESIKKWNRNFGKVTVQSRNPRLGGFIWDYENRKVVIVPNHYTKKVEVWASWLGHWPETDLTDDPDKCIKGLCDMFQEEYGVKTFEVRK